ncbi:hypothetical protein EMWEY_00051400 [Eimeria maxima]|uniref:Uncharacterized protein n=1 Tax=Eimeria maxima TaxID=5804 RepID=U6MA23_EIMMA|nr:hypothetical protein EMWEY_00051400 [Eimeria maxima]CDJ58510.1 hypothetical protein EMWEY_00051400 [Eimeria maxima]
MSFSVGSKRAFPYCFSFHSLLDILFSHFVQFSTSPGRGGMDSLLLLRGLFERGRGDLGNTTDSMARPDVPLEGGQTTTEQGDDDSEYMDFDDIERILQQQGSERTPESVHQRFLERGLIYVGGSGTRATGREGGATPLLSDADPQPTPEGASGGTSSPEETQTRRRRRADSPLPDPPSKPVWGIFGSTKQRSKSLGETSSTSSSEVQGPLTPVPTSGRSSPRTRTPPGSSIWEEGDGGPISGAGEGRSPSRRARTPNWLPVPSVQGGRRRTRSEGVEAYPPEVVPPRPSSTSGLERLKASLKTLSLRRRRSRASDEGEGAQGKQSSSEEKKVIDRV